ncbi:g5216 [Coccomyxa elongata]
MGLFGKFGAALRNVVLGRKHGADPPSAIPVKVAAAYKKAGAAAGAPKILDYNAEATNAAKKAYGERRRAVNR